MSKNGEAAANTQSIFRKEEWGEREERGGAHEATREAGGLCLDSVLRDPFSLKAGGRREKEKWGRMRMRGNGA